MERHPEDLREALSVTPLLHLIPKQDLAQLTSINSVTVAPVDSSFDISSHGSIMQVRDSINQDPEKNQGIINAITDELQNYHNDELDSIRFKLPRKLESSSDYENPILPPLESRVFAQHDDILDSMLLPLETHQTSSRLSIRKNYEDKESIIRHNEKYLRKYERELQILGIKPESEESSSQNYDSTYNASDKHSLEESYLPEPKRIQKQTYLNGEEMVSKSLHTLSVTLQELIDTGADTAEHGSHESNGTEDATIPSVDTLLIIYDNLYRVSKAAEKLDIDRVLKFQQICLRTIEEGVNDNWDDLKNLIKAENSDIAQIRQLIDRNLHYNLAAKIMMTILNLNQSDKRVHLEEYLRSVVDFVSTTFEEMIKPFIYTVKQESDALRPMFSMVSSSIVTTLDMITHHISHNTVDEHILTKLEYMAITVMFIDMGKSKNSLLVSFDSFKSSCFNLMVSIYRNVKDQRSFILNEVLSNIDKLPTQKVVARQFKLLRGGSVQFLSALLTSLIESENITTTISELTTPTNEKNTSDDVFVEIAKKTEQIWSDSSKTANDIASFLVSRLLQNPDQTTKHSLELLLEDVLLMVSFPEWPGAEPLLLALSRTFMFTIQSPNCSASLETHLLEMLGKIGEKLLSLKKLSKSYYKLSLNSPEAEYALLQSCMADTIQYLQSKSFRNDNLNQSLNFLVLKYLHYLNSSILAKSETKGTKEGESEETDTSNNPRENALSAYSYLVKTLTEGTPKAQNTLNEEAVSINSYRTLLLSQELPDFYESFLNVLLKSLESSKIKIKTRAVKILSVLIEMEPSLLLSGYIQESISNKLQDSSPLVRDAVIDLVTKYLNSKPQVIDNFYRPICGCMSDESVQVRKRALKLSKEIYLNTASKRIRSYISSRFLKRLDDEDDVIQDLARNYLLELWFSFNVIDTSNSVEKRAEVMMELIGNNKDLANFELFITRCVLADSNFKIKEALLLLITKVLDNLTETPIEEKSKEDSVEHSVEVLKLVSTLVKCDGTLLSQDQLISLQPFLIDENHNSAQALYCLEILNGSLTGIKALRPDYLELVQSYLLKHLTKFNTKELHVAMPSVWRLSEMKHETAKLANATISCMKLIKPFIEQKKSNKNKEMSLFVNKDCQKLQKLLHLLGCFGKYCKLEKHRDVFLNASLGLKDKESVISVMIKFLLSFADASTPPGIRCVAVINIINICSVHPKLFMSEAILKIFDREFENADLNILHSMIQGIMDFLKKEDSDSYKRNGVSKYTSNNTRLDIAVFHGVGDSYVNDGICAGIVQRYIKKILEFCLQDSGRFSYLPIQFLQLVVKLGFANPKLCIPTIMALESSTSHSINKIALELHQELFEKHESLMSASYTEGMKLAVEHRIRVSPKYLDEVGFIENLYSVVKNNYSSKKKFVQSLSKVFNVDMNEHEEMAESEFNRNKIAYISRNIASARFGSLEEVFILIASVDHVVSSKGVDLYEIIKEEEEVSKNHYIYAQIIIILLQLRKCLVFKYGISQSQIEAFRPGRADAELRQVVKTTPNVGLELETYMVDDDEKSHQAIKMELISLVDDYA